ncbi:MAG: hypothetical protein FWF08_05670 [Oscillospiraceae bacterium]|nr:hypothetical protein [Oscillospiraceae bacterium]
MWFAGFDKTVVAPIVPIEEREYFTAGYFGKNAITRVDDHSQCRAVVLGDGEKTVAVASLDFGGMARPFALRIQDKVNEALPGVFAQIDIVCTHTHTAIDIMGMFSLAEGCDMEFVDHVIGLTAETIINAYNSRKPGKLFRGMSRPEIMYDIETNPKRADTRLTRIRFAPDDGSKEIYLIHYTQHPVFRDVDDIAYISRDWPGVMCDLIDGFGKDSLFINGAIGGANPGGTRWPPEWNGDPDYNRCDWYGTAVGWASLLISEEKELAPAIKTAQGTANIPLANHLFKMAHNAGFLHLVEEENEDSEFNIGSVTEVGILILDDTKIAWFPGEVFPEIAINEGIADDYWVYPEREAEKGVNEIFGDGGYSLTVSLCNDHVGYILTRRDFWVEEKNPYFNFEALDPVRGRKHYQCCTSTGPMTAGILTEKLAELYSGI